MRFFVGGFVRCDKRGFLGGGRRGEGGVGGVIWNW